jgi:hypothetical protein
MKMNEDKIKQILDKIGRTDVPPNAELLAERASRNFDAALKIFQPRERLITPVRLIAAAAVVVIVFAAGRWSKSIPQASASPEIAYTQAISTYPVVQKNTDSFWQQKALAAMQPRPYAQAQFDQNRLFNAYKQYLKEKQND